MCNLASNNPYGLICQKQSNQYLNITNGHGEGMKPLLTKVKSYEQVSWIAKTTHDEGFYYR